MYESITPLYIPGNRVSESQKHSFQMPKFSLNSRPSDLCHFCCHTWWSCSNYWSSYRLFSYEKMILFVEDRLKPENQAQRLKHGNQAQTQAWEPTSETLLALGQMLCDLVVPDPLKAPWHHCRRECQSWRAPPLVLLRGNSKSMGHIAKMHSRSFRSLGSCFRWKDQNLYINSVTRCWECEHIFGVWIFLL